MALALILLGAGIGVLSFEAGSVVKKDNLTVKDVAQTLKQAGLSLNSASGVNPEEYKMGQVEPGIYQVKELNGVLLNIGKAVFYKLNGGEQIVPRGRG